VSSSPQAVVERATKAQSVNKPQTRIMSTSDTRGRGRGQPADGSGRSSSGVFTSLRHACDTRCRAVKRQHVVLAALALIALP
jgi:hypothetical protein